MARGLEGTILRFCRPRRRTQVNRALKCARSTRKGAHCPPHAQPFFFRCVRRKPSNPTPPPHFSAPLGAIRSQGLVRGWQGCVRSRGGCALRICPRHGVRRGVAQAGGRACDVEPLFWVGNHGVRKRTRTETKNMLTLLMTTTHTPCCAGAFLRSRVRRVLISSEPLCA